MEFVIVTGMSGAGKSKAIAAFEDVGYYCVDNIPSVMLPDFLELSQKNEGMQRVAVVMDSRGGSLFGSLFENLDLLKAGGASVKLLFLDTADNELMRRYKETRRRHPLTDITGGSTEEAIRYERGLLGFIKERADYVIDTTHLSSTQLREQIIALFLGDKSDAMLISVISFGFKYGIPSEADNVFDVRCLPNPFYVDALRPQTGLDQPVEDFILRSEVSRTALSKMIDLIEYLLPHYREEGKNNLVIAVGCTGGKHRSVLFAARIAARMRELGNKVVVSHRDIKKDVK